MKKQIKNYMKNPMLLVFIFIMLFFMPQAIYSPGENYNRAIVTAVGIDKVDNLYEVSLLTFIPTANLSFEEQKSVISGKGESVADAVYKAQIAMGRTVGLSHAKTTIVNEELLKEDVAVYLDYLSRVASLPENTVFIGTNTTAKELLNASQSLRGNIGLKLEQLIGYNANNVYVTDTSLEAFYKGYYSDVKSSIIGFLNVEEEGNETGMSAIEKPPQAKDTASAQGPSENGPTGQGGNSAQSSTGGQKKEKKIVNRGESILLKDGKFAEKLSVDTLNGINLLNPKAINQIIGIKGVEKEGQKIDLFYRLRDKKVLTTTKFQNGYPIFSAQVVFGLELVEIKGDHDRLKVNTEFSDITGEIADKLNIEIKRLFTDALNVLKKNKSDIIGLTEKFYSDNRKEYKEFIENNGGVENFITHVNFKLNAIVQPD